MSAFRSFGVGPKGVPAYFDRKFGDSDVVHRIQRGVAESPYEKALLFALIEWETNRQGCPSDETLLALARTMGVVSSVMGAPQVDLKAELGLPEKIEMVPEFCEAAAREALAMSLTLLCDQRFPDPIAEMLKRIDRKQWTLVAGTAADMVRGRGVSRIGISNWRATVEFAQWVEDLAGPLMESCPAGIPQPLARSEVIEAVRDVDHDELMVFAGGGGIPSSVRVVLGETLAYTDAA